MKKKIAAILAAFMMLALPAWATTGDTSDEFYRYDYVGISQTCVNPSHTVHVTLRSKNADGYVGVRVAPRFSTAYYTIGVFPNSGTSWKTTKIDTDRSSANINRVFANSDKSNVIVEFVSHSCET